MKLGVDLVFIPELKTKLGKDFDLAKVFTQAELEQNQSPESLAGIYAAKEAFMKALGRKINWLAVWIEKEKTGQPKLSSSIEYQSSKIELSISHSGDYALAIVIIN